MKAIRRFHPYIHGGSFTIRTEHAALRWLLNFKCLEGWIARDQFIDSLPEEDMRLRIRQIWPANLWQALEAALELESYIAASRRSRPVREVLLEGGPEEAEPRSVSWSVVWRLCSFIHGLKSTEEIELYRVQGLLSLVGEEYARDVGSQAIFSAADLNPILMWPQVLEGMMVQLMDKTRETTSSPVCGAGLSYRY